MERPDRWLEPLWEAQEPRARLTVLPWLAWAVIFLGVIELAMCSARL